MSAQAKKVRIILTLPRCGTHFIWSRLIQSGRYQLIYDADRIPALDVLARKYPEKLQFLCPTPRNPNYNFQYNSLREVSEPLSASEHLARLMQKHSVSDSFALFEKLMSLQDHGDRTLFSVNRFVYTCSNDHFRGSKFEWSTECAMEALRQLHDWFGRLGCETRFSLVIRQMDDWIESQMARRAEEKVGAVRRRLESAPALLKLCGELKIPVFFMEDVIDSINAGTLEFESALKPLPAEEVRRFCEEASHRALDLRSKYPSKMPRLLRVDRLVQYLRERDPIKRTSLVRSIGHLPVRISPFIPFLGRKIRDDFEGVALDNARILR